MSRSEFARRLTQSRVAAGLSERQLDARIHAANGTVEQLEAGIAAIPDMSTVALLAEGCQTWPSNLDTRFDSELNHSARNFARVAGAKGFRTIEAKQLWDSVFDRTRYRGVISTERWHEAASQIAHQKDLGLDF